MDEELNFNFRDLVKFSKTMHQKTIFIKVYTKKFEKLRVRWVLFDDFKNLLGDSTEYMTQNKPIEDLEVHIMDCIKDHYFVEFVHTYTIDHEHHTYILNEII